MMAGFLAAGCLASLSMCADIARSAPLVELAAAGNSSAEKAVAAPNRGHTIRSRRRPHVHAMPRGQSDRRIQLQQQRDGVK